MFCTRSPEAVKSAHESGLSFLKSEGACHSAIMPKIPEISVGIQMERPVSVSSDRNIRGAFHYAKLTGQRSVGIPVKNGTTFSD